MRCSCGCASGGNGYGGQRNGCGCDMCSRIKSALRNLFSLPCCKCGGRNGNYDGYYARQYGLCSSGSSCPCGR